MSAAALAALPVDAWRALAEQAQARTALLRALVGPALDDAALVEAGVTLPGLHDAPMIYPGVDRPDGYVFRFARPSPFVQITLPLGGTLWFRAYTAPLPPAGAPVDPGDGTLSAPWRVTSALPAHSPHWRSSSPEVARRRPWIIYGLLHVSEDLGGFLAEVVAR